jgi:serine/threonine-protein kinase
MTSLSPEIESTYEVLQTMGGGMGAVYKVRHRLFNEIRVIKVMQAALAENQALKDRFSAEAKRGKQLKHRNIAEVLDFQIGSNGNPHLVMEYVDGVNLRDEFVRRGAPLDPQSVARIGVQTLSALGYLHERHLIHRDISPDNLMITRDADGTTQVKLIDLGIAKSLIDETAVLTRAGDFMGKMSYASPEQFSGIVDARSDFYSLGVVLYELLTTARPITGATTAALIMAHCQTAPRPFSETDPEGRVPAALRAVVLKALEKKPEDRYQTAAEFAAALKAAVPGVETTITKTVTLPPPMPPSLPATTPSPPPPLPRADRTIIAPRSETRGNARTFLWLAAAAAGVALVAFAATALLEKAKARDVVPIATTSSTQPAGATIAIEAPDPNRPAPRRPTTAAAVPPPVLIETAPTTTTTAPAPPPVVVEPAPVTATFAPPVTVSTPPPPPPSVTSRNDIAEGDRLRRQALALSNAHRWAEAIPAWRQFLRDYAGMSPAVDHAAYYNLGVAYESLQEWRDGADAFERASLADPRSNDTNNLLRLGRCYGKLGRWRDAAAAYERVLQIDPANDVARRSLLVARQQLR